jgi:TrmH family RNA methyltransferase
LLDERRAFDHRAKALRTVSGLYNRLLQTESQSVGGLPLRVVLVSPRNPLNIGAVARAMANFGFRELSVVAPFAEHWREARSAVGAPELLRNANESATLAEAIADCTLVLGTGTLAYRKPEQKVVLLPALAPIVLDEFDRGGRIALLFGPEKHGLTREDLSWCHRLIEIPTDPEQPSMNLGQAVAVCLYELGPRAFPPQARSVAAQPDNELAIEELAAQPAPAPSASLDLLAGVIEETMLASGYSPASMHAANRHDLRLLLRRLSPGIRDTRRILGLFRRILWHLDRRAGQG